MRDPSAQGRRKREGSRWERAAYDTIRRDPKLQGHRTELVSNGSPGLDMHIYPPKCVLSRDPSCGPPERIEIKSVEKLFEPSPEDPWPPTRLSRFVLKPHEARDPPACYALVVNDEVTGKASLDVVDSKAIIKFIRANRGKSPKLSVRAIPVLRKNPCKLLKNTRFVV